ncbi:hypothetical protein HPB51_013373 [Rhipicephalus microplus]|uniref:Uncharacterized protein n=1 Tax=Rhipicephalus microplus TaxID=6941 RepID=A0A9J6F445_RHIMP|nr:hypothetical protein HPB51_013373 [Rhipicephalus microplus]
MANQKAVAKTDMAAVITDNKSGAPDRPPAVSQKLKKEEAVYQRDVLGKKDVPLPVTTDESVGGKKHEMTNLLQREEARLQKIGRHLDKPELLEQNLREQTTQRGESEFASSANIKTDDNMRMTDDVRGPSPNENAGPQRQQAPGGGGAGGAPMRLPSKEKVAPGKATGTSYAADGNYPKTDTAAGITDNRSKLSKTAQDEVRRQEEIYARDRLKAPVLQGLPVAGLPRQSAPTSNQAHIQRKTGAWCGNLLLTECGMKRWPTRETTAPP